MTVDVALVTMPWGLVTYPSIQLGTVKALLAEHGHSARVHYFNLTFAELAIAATADGPADERITLEDVLGFGDEMMVGDWVFAVPSFRPVDDAGDRGLLDLRKREDGTTKLYRLRALAPAFLEQCADELIASGVRIVGFSSSFNQNVASLALAQIVKQRAPHIAIMFGGANCDGPMGEALHRLFPFIDVVIRGEAERVLAPVVEDLLASRPVRTLPGVCVRHDGASVVNAQGHELVAMSEVPMPDYDEFFERLDNSSVREELFPKVRLVYESARGCWWGEKNHCTFCGLNGSAMTFRSKNADKTFDEMVALSQRYHSTRFQIVDNIIELRYLHELLPRLRDMPCDWDLFYETKANLKREQLRLFRQSGVRVIQPGIESLSSPILKLMKKGVTALQNVRLLKWCAELGIRVEWNLIAGFPGEDPAEYEAMANAIPSLVHLAAPNMSALSLERFSPYHERPQTYGISNVEVAPWYPVLYPVDPSSLDQLAYTFSFEYADSRDLRGYVKPVSDAVAMWRNTTNSGALLCESGQGFVVIEDHRTTVEPAHYTFEEQEALIYLACDAGATPRQIHGLLVSRGHVDFSIEEVREFLDSLVDLRLLYRERDRYLSLAVARDQQRALLRETVSPFANDDEMVGGGLLKLGRAAGT